MIRRALVATLILFLSAASAFCGTKPVQIDTIPEGAQVEVNGSVTCKTPCTLKVPSYYFGKKRTVFSSHGVEPIRVRMTKEGFAPKTVELTIGPIHWHNLYGNNLYDYYLMSSESFKFELDEIKEFIPEQQIPSSLTLTSTNSSGQIPVEDIVRQSLPAVVIVSTPKGSGSGFFVSADGLVVTSAHVVDGETSATVTTASGRTLESTHLYADQNLDLALVKVPLKDNAFLKLNEAPPPLGSEVIAIGTPGANDATGTLMLPNTITKGIVSGVRRFPDETIESLPGRAGLWIQTDATINHGNSGGPLLDRSGQVVGINTLAFSATGTPGINFALASIELVKMVQARFETPGSSPRAEPASLPAAAAAAQTASLSPDASRAATAIVSFSSNPSGADIEVDGLFVGSTPSDVPLAIGQRHVKISKKKSVAYERTIQVMSGGKQRIAVDLEPE